MHKILSYILLSIIISMVLMQISPVIAQAHSQNERPELIAEVTVPYIPQPGTLPGPTEKLQETATARGALVNTLIPKFTTGMVGMAAAFATLFLIIGGIRFAVSYGKDESIENAKKQIIYALVGLLLSLLSYIIVIIVINLKFVEDKGF